MKDNSIAIIESVALEVTRRCNDKCEHCMRGNSQNVNMNKNVVDNLLDRKNIIIMKLIFSGGEPLLNEDLIIYAIDKIINANRIVLQIEITTNGKIYSKRVVEKLKEYKQYIKNKFPEFLHLINTEQISCIRISNDQFHHVDEKVIKKYMKEEISIIKTGKINELDDKLLLTGRAKNRMFGKYFEYKLKDINVKELQPSKYFFKNNFYITAKGNITTQGDGTYEDMDIINLGPLENFEFNILQKNKIKKF